MANPIKKPQLSDGTGINYRSLLAFLKAAENDLRYESYDDTADILENMIEWLENDVANGKPFEYKSIILGL